MENNPPEFLKMTVSKNSKILPYEVCVGGGNGQFEAAVIYLNKKKTEAFIEVAAMSTDDDGRVSNRFLTNGVLFNPLLNASDYDHDKKNFVEDDPFNNAYARATYDKYGIIPSMFKSSNKEVIRNILNYADSSEQLNITHPRSSASRIDWRNAPSFEAKSGNGKILNLHYFRDALYNQHSPKSLKLNEDWFYKDPNFTDSKYIGFKYGLFSCRYIVPVFK